MLHNLGLAYRSHADAADAREGRAGAALARHARLLRAEEALGRALALRSELLAPSAGLTAWQTWGVRDCTMQRCRWS